MLMGRASLSCVVPPVQVLPRELASCTRRAARPRYVAGPGLMSLLPLPLGEFPDVWEDVLGVWATSSSDSESRAVSVSCSLSEAMVDGSTDAPGELARDDVDDEADDDDDDEEAEEDDDDEEEDDDDDDDDEEEEEKRCEAETDGGFTRFCTCCGCTVSVRETFGIPRPRPPPRLPRPRPRPRPRRFAV